MSLPLTVLRGGILAIAPSPYSKTTTKFVPVDAVSGFTIKAGYDRSTLIIHSQITREDIAVFENLLNPDLAIVKAQLLTALSNRSFDNGLLSSHEERVSRLESAVDKMRIMHNTEVFDKSIYEMDGRVGKLETIVGDLTTGTTCDAIEKTLSEIQDRLEFIEDYMSTVPSAKEKVVKDDEFDEDSVREFGVKVVVYLSTLVLAGSYIIMKYPSICGSYCPF